MKNFNLLFVLIFLLFCGCTHYQAVPFEELQSKGLIGRWEMNLDPYFIDINCAGEMAFVRPSGTMLYGDQKGSNFIITQFKENQIITGPILRVAYNIEEWPHDDNGRTLMTFDNRIWHKEKSYKCY